jgi:hypothetical protein
MTNGSSETPAQADGFDRRGALKMIGLSLTINALCPFVLYRALQSHFPANSVVPLLYATIFPVFGVMLGIVRKRTVDVIAIIAMAALAVHIAVTLVARDVGVALIAISLDGAIIGLALIVSALIGHPLILIVAKQVASGGSPERAAPLNRMVENDGRRTFITITLAWGLGMVATSGLHVLLALKLPPADFLLVSPIIGVITIVALLAWTGRFLMARTRGLVTRGR